VVALNLQPTYQSHFIPGASSSFALMLLANKNSKSQQTTTTATTHSPSEEQVKNPSSQMPEIMYLDIDLQRERLQRRKSLHHLQRRSLPSHSNDDVHYMSNSFILFFKIHFMLFTIYLNSGIIISSFFGKFFRWPKDITSYNCL
jgi:hypothetical protein